MAKTSAEVITHCPHQKCGKPIYSDHINPWCIECGEPLPDNIQEQIPQLREFREKASVARSSPPEPRAVDAAGLAHRYRDAYSVARVIVGAGNGVKTVGVIVGILFALSGFVAKGSFVFLGLMAALTAGVFFYVAGVAISAQGQLLQATLDSAVNTSPLLDNEQKAQILALGS
jgi:hypothetical protein